MDDASLDEFANRSGEGDDGEDERSESSESASGEARPASGDADGRESVAEDAVTGGEDPPDPSQVAPAASTYAWTGDDAVCGACGESVERRWRDGDELVCADCKGW